MSVWYEGGSALSRSMDVVVQTGLKAVMVEGQLIVKLCTVRSISLFHFEGDFGGDQEEGGTRTEGKGRVGWSYLTYSCQTNCVPAAEAEKG